MSLIQSPILSPCVEQLVSSTVQIAYDQSRLLSAVAVSVLFHLILRYRQSPWRHLPPGPTGYPILGSALKLFDKHWLFYESKQKYGDIVYLNVIGQPTIILNSQRVAADLLDRRASTFSGRPRLIIGYELLTQQLLFALGGHNDRWRRMRRAVNEAFNVGFTGRYHGMEAEEAIRLALALTAEPSEFIRLYDRYAASLVMMITYDRPLHGSEKDDAIHERLHASNRRSVDAITPGAHLVEFFPWMLRLPTWLAKWKRDALNGYQETTELYEELVDDVVERRAKGSARDCLTTVLTEEQERFGLSRPEVLWSAGTMYAAATETMATMLGWWTLAMVAFPDAQRTAQDELDTVLGQARPPRVGDRPQLPYTSALVRETLRWRSGLPLGLPHVNEQDDWYEGMFIPKGTVIFANVIGCNHDPEIYGEDARTFNPSRHLNTDGQLKPAAPDTKDEGHVSFGFGRRICVGRHVADDALFAAIAILLWSFKFEKSEEVSVGIDHDTREDDADSGCFRAPQSFRCKITPRLPETLDILTREMEAR
ncbi:cytochrome P450 [Vararia minispora EC-137]|uniref:Cytochrome P450 n=1 Tax=Vararia minispora EC-137 TaxID=1314806 RepID=A0ACB8QIV3_9AGAM|nr:cytochrome P450 [Vararia minispora EC-137]